jgi:hypothetical protein
MKIIYTSPFAILLVALFLCSNGCTTYNTVQYAKGYSENATWFTFPTRDTKPKPPGDHKPHPGYYALTPLTVPADVATSPFQFFDYLYVILSGFGYQ